MDASLTEEQEAKRPQLNDLKGKWIVTKVETGSRLPSPELSAIYYIF